MITALGELSKPPIPAEQMTAADVLRQVQLLREHRPHTTYRDGPESKPRERRMQYRFHSSTHVIRAMFPGNGAGKTTTMGVEVDWWAQHNHPYRETPKTKFVGVWFTLKFQQFEIIREQLERRCFTAGWHWNEQKKCYTWPNGSRLFVFSADADWKAAQGIGPDLIVFDENPPVAIWREMQMRRRGDKQTEFLIGATATQGLTWMHSDVYLIWLKHHQDLGLNEDQAMVEQRHPYIFCWPRGGLEDNPGMTAEDLKWYRERVAYSSPAEKIVRTAGGFLDFNSTPVFDQEALVRMHGEVLEPAPRDGLLLQITEPKMRRFPERPFEFQFVRNGVAWKGGRITIYEPPAAGENYAIGADTGWGLQTSDFSTASVGRRWLDKQGRVHVTQVAEAEGRWSLVPFTWVLWALGWFYNEALIAIERNNGGLEVCRHLYDARGYAYQYFEIKDKQKAVKHTDLLGFTKFDDRLITRVHHFLGPYAEDGSTQPHQLHLRSGHAWRQLQQYQFRPRSKRVELASAGDDDLIMTAPPGQNDDLVIAIAAMIMAAVELPRFIKPQKVTYNRGTAGDVLKHAEVNAPPKRVGAFKFGRK